ncbi:MAG: sulfite exporter TauE/SafE family protein [Phycisphaerales bacterium]
MPLGTLDIVLLVIIGLTAGILGGMLGIGGSVVMVPALVILTVGRSWHSQHLFQAAAMCVNVIIAIPAALKHRAKGAIRPDLFKIMLPATLVAILVGVAVSNLLSSELLKRLFGLFMLFIAGTEAWRFFRRPTQHAEPLPIVTVPRAGTVGGVMGFFAGLLGIGGGLIAVPLAQWLCRVPVRQAIGASAAVMGFTAAIGAAFKVATLPTHNASPTHALTLAALLGLGAVAGARFGASMTHRAPVNLIRGIFLVVLVIAALRLILH